MVTSSDSGQPNQPSPSILTATPKLPSSTLSHERQIAEIARDQLGLITVKQAAGVGVDRSALRRRERAGLLKHVFVGVYRIAGVEATFRQESLAACLAVRDSAVSGLSAALVHGIPVGGVKPARPSIVVDAKREIVAKGIQTRRTRHFPPTQPWSNGRITTVPATIVDLAGLVSPDLLGRSLDHVLANRSATIASVLTIVNERPPARFLGRAALLAMLEARTDPKSGGKVLFRSGYERSTLRWMLAAGLPRPSSNMMIEGIEIDFGWPEFKIALEISPFFTHGSELAQRRDAQRRRLLQKVGWRVIEATDEHLGSATAFASIVSDIFVIMRSVA